jgi:hypothetical protein
MLSYNFFGVLFNPTKLDKEISKAKKWGRIFFVLLYKAHAPMLAVKKTDQPIASW